MTTSTLLTSAWSFRPLLFLCCVAALVVHARRGGLRSARRTASLGVAVAVLVFALASPVDALAGGYLFSAHMLQHLLLVLVVPPLLLMALAPQDGAPRAPLDRVSRWLLAHPSVTWGAGLGAMWLWHERTLCNAASESEAVRGLQSISLVVMGALFYWPLLAPRASWRMSALTGMAYLFSACIGCTLLGILITFSPVSVCPAFLHPVDPRGMLGLVRNHWGISAGDDQKIAGLLMWVPACTIYGTGILGMVGRHFAPRSGNAEEDLPDALRSTGTHERQVRR